MSDRVIFKSIWLLVGAAILSLFPFTVFSTFLVPIAEVSGHTSAEIGTLRGLGGIAALVVGIGFAPIINRFIKQRVAVFSLLLLGWCVIYRRYWDVSGVDILLFCHWGSYGASYAIATCYRDRPL